MPDFLIHLPLADVTPTAMTTGPIDAFYQHVSAVLDGAYAGISPALLFLWQFFIVVGIAWMGVLWAVSEAPVAAQGLRRLLFLSVILFVAQHWVELTVALADGFSKLGILAAGADGFDATTIDRPSSFGTHAFSTAFLVLNKATALATGWRGTLANLPIIALLLAAGLGVFACGAAVVLLILTYLVLFKLGCVVVFCLLPFGALDRTAWVVERPLGWVMSNGIRFLVLSLVVGLLYRFADDATAQALNVQDGTWTDLGGATAVALQLLLVNLLLLVFVVMANRFAGEIAGGAATLTLSDFTNRAAASGTGEPIVRATAGAAGSAARHAAVGTGLGLLAAGAVAGGVWSKSRQRAGLGGDVGVGDGASGGASPPRPVGSAAATASGPITAMLRSAPPASPRPMRVEVVRPPTTPDPRADRPPLPPGQSRFLPS